MQKKGMDLKCSITVRLLEKPHLIFVQLREDALEVDPAVLSCFRTSITGIFNPFQSQILDSVAPATEMIILIYLVW